ncbi:MAG: class I SAM-dependent methyltransferase [Acidobacteriota bacterium]
MERSNTERIAELEATSWWYRARRDLLDGLLERYGPFAYGLDFGCGVGANLATLGTHCRRSVAFDPSFAAAAHAAGAETTRVGPAVSLLVADGLALPMSAGAVDLVACLDVLEHVDDGRALGEIQRVLRPGGLLIVTVPAHPHLWNENDEFSHHLRRYRRRDLKAALAAFDVLELTYWNVGAYLPALAYATWRRRFPIEPRNNLDAVPSLTEEPLRRLATAENRLRRWLPVPTGTSLVAVARKPSHA